MSRKQPDVKKDWRGTPIEIGATVIYGGPVSRSIQMVEAEVIGFTPSDRVRLKIIRRSFTGSYKEWVDVGHDRLTVVDSLPPCDLPTADDEITKRKAYEADRDRMQATHDLKPRVEAPKDPKPRYGYANYAVTQAYREAYRKYREESDAWYKHPCKNCDASFSETMRSECPNGQD